MTRLFVFRVFNLAVALASLLYIVWAGAEARGYFERNVLCVLPAINNNSDYFTPDDLQSAQRNGFNGMIVAESLENTVVALGEMKAPSGVAVTGRDYFDMCRMRFIDGGPWIAAQENERVIILSESLAWLLFGDTKSSGLTVFLNDDAYTVTGVAAQGKVSREGAFAWIPPCAEDGDLYSNALYIKPESYNLLDARLGAEAMLGRMNRPVRDYVITDLNSYAKSINLRGSILMCLLGLYIIFLMLLYLFRLGKSALKEKTGKVALIVLIPVVAVVSVLIMNQITFDIWAPAFAGEGIKGYAQVFFNAGLLTPEQYLSYNLKMLHSLNLSANVAFGAGLVGIIQFAFFTSCKQQKRS